MKFLFKKYEIKYLVSYFILIDLLLLPYFQGIIIPFSLPLILLCFFLFNIKIDKNYDFFLFVIIFFTVILSLVISLLLPNRELWHFDNIKRAIQLLTSFLYFFYFRWFIQRYDLNIFSILIIFILWFNFLGTLYFFEPSVAKDFIRTIYGRLVDPEGTTNITLRFSYIFTDPNTAAYFYLIAISPFFVWYHQSTKNIKISLFFFTFVFIISFCLFITQSFGGVIALCVMMLISVLPNIISVRNYTSFKFLFSLTLFLSFILILFIFLINLSVQNEIFLRLLEKIFSTDNEHLSDYRESGGKRFIIWAMTYEFFGFPYPLGRGFSLISEDGIWSPHSDLLHLSYAYGFIAAISIFLFLFRLRFSLLILLIPAFFPFMINSLLGEQKLLALYFSLLAIFLGKNYNNKQLISKVDLQNKIFLFYKKFNNCK